MPVSSSECIPIARGLCTQASGREDCATVEALWFGLTQLAMKVTGSTTRRVEPASSSTPMATSMTGAG